MIHAKPSWKWIPGLMKSMRANRNGREFKTHNPKGTTEMENGKPERRVAMESVKHWKEWKIRKRALVTERVRKKWWKQLMHSEKTFLVGLQKDKYHNKKWFHWLRSEQSSKWCRCEMNNKQRLWTKRSNHIGIVRALFVSW